MRLVIIMAVLLVAGTARGQVINGESTDDSAYAPRPPARWSPPSGEPQSSDTETRSDDRSRSEDR